MPADQFLAHELNARRHPGQQRDALRGSLNAVGWIAPVIVSKRTGKLLDGHARIEEALTKDESALVPFVSVDVDEAEEALILGTFDPITNQATYDREALDGLLRQIETSESGLQQLLADLAAKQGVIPISDDEWKGAFNSLPDGDKSPFQQMTFTLSNDQAETVKRAIDRAKQDGEFINTGNENSNGNALARLAEAYCG